MNQSYEKLGLFYLGRIYNPAERRAEPDVVLYDAKDLTTHAVIIGMTGSGKTGLGIGLIEEALIDNIPVIAIDPKGDLPNLLLHFPNLNAEDFRPWINAQDAARQGMTPEQFSAEQADAWRQGLAEWDQDPKRITRLASSAEFTVYTPGSNAGRPVSVLRNFTPPPAVMQDMDLLRERIQSTVTGLLGLVGIDADPIASREHILLAHILQTAWAEDRTLDLAGLIQLVQSPPFERIGVMSLATFFTEKDRFALAMRLNNLLAAPGFEAWMEGPPLEIGRFLHTEQGRPRASIFTISHLSDAQRMFFVTFLLNQILGWLRSQPGTASLRAILYMDEIFGYFPPVSNPPSKGPLLTLLKQARAYGLGIVLSTQNPVDLDYKGLANTGTWFIGRLQTERDKERVLAGLEGAAIGEGFDRGRMEEVLAGLGKRVFLLHNVHDAHPVIFQTRWLLSYLSGPMTRDQIRRLTENGGDEIPGPTDMIHQRLSPLTGAKTDTPPILPPGIDVFYLDAPDAGRKIAYTPAVIGRMDVHYSHARHAVDLTRTLTIAAPFDNGTVPFDWDYAVPVDTAVLTTDPAAPGEYGGLPAAAQTPSAFAKWRKDLVRWVCRNRPVTLYEAKSLHLISRPEESEGQFRARLSQAAREARDIEVEKLRRKYADRFAGLQDRLMRADQAVEREQDQVRSRSAETAISFGSAILGAFLGRKVISATSASRMGTAIKSAGRIRKEKMDVARARERADAVRLKLDELARQLQQDIDALEIRLAPEAIPLQTIDIRPRNTDVAVELFGLAWLPFHRSPDGRLTPGWA